MYGELYRHSEGFIPKNLFSFVLSKILRYAQNDITCSLSLRKSEVS